MSDINVPLTPPGCDLRDFAYMPLDVSRLRDSDLASTESPEACWAAVLLWAASWHQIPAASLPDDDRVLSNLSGYGRVVKEWMRVKNGALRGWVKCSDGRLYHPVVAEKARESWASKLSHAYGKMAERLRKTNKHRTENSLPIIPQPPFDEWVSSGKTDPVPLEMINGSAGIPPENKLPSGGKNKSSAGIPPEKALKGEVRERERDIQIPSVAEATASGAGGEAELTKVELWSAGKSILAEQGMPIAQCGSFVGKLVKDYGDGVVIEAVRAAVVQRPADVAQYLVATCQNASGQRKPANKQEALEARNRALAEEMIAEFNSRSPD